MAKGNMLQGMARGKVGDVVFSRLNGEQIARVRNRNPKNPRTNAQLYQRAIMATVMQAYSVGKAIFDHAFQGYSVGEGCQRRFMTLNAKRLRNVLASDLQAIAQGSEPSYNGFNAPGTKVATLNELQISEGTYGLGAVNGVHGFPEPLENEKISEYAARVGLKAGDIYTIVGLTTKGLNDVIFEVNGETSLNAKQLDTYFGFYRMKVKENISQIQTVVTSATKVDILFDVTMGGDAFQEDYPAICEASDAEVPWAASTLLLGEGTYSKVAGVIRSRLDEDVRSNSYLEFVAEDSFTINDAAGITAKYLLDAWKQGTVAVGNSDLILEGGDQ